ncbi:hypothetical protein J3R83DRAFT_11898 [Lanmaoa asiatica]|nr:hypothetical protein J3R83DRAFT_11898 [Lanmaoa asiatica]
MPDPSSISFPGPSRSNSLASTASSSGASLTRRSRITRKRTQTITAGSHRDEKSTGVEDQVLDISAANNADSASGLVVRPSGTPNVTLVTHPRPGADSALGSDIRSGSDADRSCTTFGTFGPLTDSHEALPGDSVHVHPLQSQPGVAPSSETVVPPPTTKGKGRHPPRLTSPPSSFKPAPTDADRVRSNLRDSLITQQSSTSSSVYPMSTSMGTESPPSPLSPVLPDHGVPVPAFEFDGPKVQEFDADDVSYRLQLLVKNNYFLPPAHSKPSPADFPSSLNSSKKAPSPTFLDLFRVGKPKSKPASPDVANGTSPIFRVTSDSTTASGQVVRDNGRPSPQTFRPPPGSQHMARVVVVREKMQDLAAAARQAEMDLGRHDFVLDRDRVSRRSKFATFDGIVDPTETVDVPPPSANYPLALQASALHGLGIEDSVGAAILAERLPPPGSPGQSSLDPREDAWRKALLREAVGHSLNTSRATSSASRYSTPMKSPFRAQSSESLRPDRAVEQQRRLLDQKILRHPIIDPSEDFAPPIPMASSASNPSALVAVVADPDLRRLSNLALLRAETPVPHTPLSPPPRRPFCNPQFSQSQINISPVLDSSACQTPRKLLRKSISSPMLSKRHGCKTNGTVTPSKSPPMPTLSVSPAPSSFDNRMSRITRYTSSEHDDQVVDDQQGRPSLAMTLPSTDGRPSISEYSQPSPTASAFRDRWSDGYYSASSGGPGESAHSSFNSPILHPHPRPSTMSPPPRPSSSIVGIALSPPPRRGRLPFQPTSSRILAIAPTRPSSQGTVHSFASNSTLSQSTHAPPPLFLNVSSQSFHSAFHSAPPPSSTTEFFDHIQAHTDAMDDLDDSDDSASETDQDVTAVYGSSSGGPKLMQLGNLSTPNVYPGAKEPYYPSVTPTERRRPVGHTAAKTPYFSSVKGAPDSLTHLSLAQHSREHLPIMEPSPNSRPATAGAENVRRWQRDQEAFQQSSKRLDGLLIRHMQAEKDTLKRIAETAKVAKS